MEFRAQVEQGKEKIKNFAKKKVKKAIRKFIRQVLKKLLIKLVMLIVKAIVAAVGALVATLGIPLAIMLAILIILGGAMFILAPSLGLIDSDSPVSQEELVDELNSLIVNSSTDPNYRPPFELVSSIDMMRIIQDDQQPWEVDFKPIVDELEPNLTYETYKDTYEIKTVKTRTYEVTKEIEVEEQYEDWDIIGYEQKQVGTETIQDGTKKEFVCSPEEAYTKPPTWVEIHCWEEVPVYKEVPIYEDVPKYGWVTKTKKVKKTVTEEKTDVSTDVNTEQIDVTFLKTAHAWNRFETFYYKEIALSKEFERIEVKEDGDTITEIYKRKTKEWVFDHKDLVHDYSKFDNAIKIAGLDDEAVKLLVASLIENNISMDGYMGEFFDIFVDGGMSMLVPQEYIQIYKAAEAKYKVDWNYLAAIHRVETVFSTLDPMISYVGAIGHMQFMPCTFTGWAHPTCSGSGKGDIPENIMTDPSMIAKYGGVGVDGNGDGKADPWDLEDAVFSTANYLNESGFGTNIKKAIKAYNHSDQYVADVVQFAELFKNSQGVVPPISPGTFTRPAAGPITSGMGPRWGKTHGGVDIGRPPGVQTVPIVAAASGVVRKSYTSSSYGETIIIRHNIDGEVWETLYAHMVTGSRRYQNGEAVNKGDIIGIMGTTGISTGVHLHFEVHNNGGWNNSKSNRVDPETVVQF